MGGREVVDAQEHDPDAELERVRQGAASPFVSWGAVEPDSDVPAGVGGQRAPWAVS